MHRPADAAAVADRALRRAVATVALLTGLGGLAVNLVCAAVLVRFRAHRGSLTRAAFLSARNDAFANVAIVGAGAVTAAILSPWPDPVVGLGIFLINLDAAREVFAAASAERRSEPAKP